jgi:nucleoside diphosphate kinase
MTTLLILKPDGVKRKLESEFKAFLSNNKIKIVSYRHHTGSYPETVEKTKQLYKEHYGKKFYAQLLDMMFNGRFIVYKVESPFLDVEGIREIALKFRDKYAMDKTRNTIHASDNEIKAKIELNIFEL